MNLDELEQSLKAEGKKSPQKVIVFGDPKVGKTELVGKLAHHFPMTWFDLEDGHATLLKLPSEAKKNINLIQVPDTRESPQAQDTIRRIFTNPGPHKICADHGKSGAWYVQNPNDHSIPLILPISEKTKSSSLIRSLNFLIQQWQK